MARLSDRTWRTLGLIFLALLVLYLICTAPAAGDEPLTRLVPIHQTSAAPSRAIWNWTQPAPHHRAIVGISSGGYAGTGCMVDHDGQGVLVITNDHIFSGSTATISGSSGSATGVVIARNPGLDLCVLWARTATAGTALPIGAYTLPLGTPVELCGYGGPRPDSLRHFSGRVIASEYGQGVSVAAPVISGDSGAPILHEKNIVGINFGGPNVSAARGSWDLVYPASSHVDGPVLARYLTQICRPYRMQPRIIYGPPQQPSPMYPPAPPPAQPSQPPALNPPSNAPPQVVQGERGPRGPRGPQGAQGPQGPPGTGVNVDIDELAEAVIAKLPPFYPMWIDGDGNVIDSLPQGVKLGQTLPLRVEVLYRAGTRPNR